MQSAAKTVPAYLQEVPVERKAVLKKLRDLCRAILTGFEESMHYDKAVTTLSGGALGISVTFSLSMSNAISRG